MIDTTIFENKTAVYYTLGCKLNFAETSTIGKQLAEVQKHLQLANNWLKLELQKRKKDKRPMFV